VKSAPKICSLRLESGSTEIAITLIDPEGGLGRYLMVTPTIRESVPQYKRREASSLILHGQVNLA
jgi:hypothetical protein